MNNILKVFTFLALIMQLSYSLSAADYNIKDFGAKGDGVTLNTTYIQAAIDSAHHVGGGRVVIPSGIFLSGSLVLKSNVELHLKKKAVLLGSTNIEDYYSIIREWKAIIMAKNEKNIKVTGIGRIDGQGKCLALKIDSLFYAGKLDSLDYNFNEKRPKVAVRPQIILFFNCKNIRIESLSINNSSSYVQSYIICDNLIIDNIIVESNAYWNNDGIDIFNSKNVRIVNSKINSSDDGICLKSDKTFSRHSTGCDSIYIGNCIVRSSASAIKLGAASYGDFKNIIIKNIKVYDTYRSAIAIESCEGGVIENINVQNIIAKNTGNAIFIRLSIRDSDKLSYRPPGSIKNISIKNVKVVVPYEQPDYYYNLRGPVSPFFHNVFPSSITGTPGFKVENVTLENIKIVYPGRGNSAYANMPINRLSDVPEKTGDYPEFSMFGELPSWGFYVRHIDGLIMKNIKVKIKKPDYRPAFVFDDVLNLTLKDIIVKGDIKANPIILKNVKMKE